MLSDPSAPPAAPPSFGQRLRQWRGFRRLSQLDLSSETGVSTRHISFLETGRSQPSREMVLRLATALDLPQRAQNALLVAAGYAPIHEERPLDHPALGPARDGIEFLLRAHDPFPAFALDRGWNIVRSNRSHRRMLELTLGGRELAEPVNVLMLCFDPQLLRPLLVDWDEVASALLRRLDRQLELPQSDGALDQLHRRVLALPGVAELAERPVRELGPAPLVPLALQVGDQRLSWLTTLATFGAAVDMTLQEVTIELLYPADAPTEALARDLERREPRARGPQSRDQAQPWGAQQGRPAS